VGHASNDAQTPARGYGLLALWGVATMGYLIAALEWRVLLERARSCRPLSREALRSWGPVLAITLLAGALRLWDLNGIPYITGGDETSLGWGALEVQAGHLTNPFATGWLSHPTLFFYLQAQALRVWPDPVAGLRLAPALAGTLTVPAVYLLGSEIFSQRVGLVAALYLAGWHYAIHFSRLGLNNILDPLVAALALSLLLVGLRTKHRAPFAAAGILMGLGQYGYMSARLVPLVAGAYVLWRMLTERGFWRRQRGLLLVLSGGFLVAAAPLLLFWLSHSQDMLARLSSLSILQSGWLATNAARLGRSQVSLLGDQLLKATLGWHYFRDTSPHYGPGRPLLGALDGALFVLGLALAMLPRRPRGAGLLALLFWSVAILGGALLENPPSAPRLLLSTVAIPVLLAWGLWEFAGAMGSILSWRTAWTRVVVGLCLAGTLAASVDFYFLSYAPARTYPGLNSLVDYQMGLYLKTLPGEARYLFHGAPRMYAGSPNARYLAPQARGKDVIAPLEGPAEDAPDGQAAVHIFLPERLGDLEWVQAGHLEGVLREFRQSNGELLFAVFEPG
jgi:4-amino-4-deoxy-L-arabinose transferase-like glycosyltransferase